ncbi:MAG: menaquinone biosynthesis protein [Pirellulaceae bacterium]|jgi:chorismate dehydratase|nr:menaquinone biosynthesis protein [Pirellulaceae bacterium]MDP6717680.1 menaquinone biosynthesis protein [Pirellulaceae bacterium]
MSVLHKLRIGAVSYLNTKPLVYQLDKMLPNAEIVYDLPSRLSDDLAGGSLDIALIPSVESFRDSAYQIISDACIACRGPVLSVKLLSRCPFDQIKTLALDEGSRTSVALARILLQQRFQLSPSMQPFPIGSEIAETTADAVLLIGDRAMHSPAGFVAEWDLGDQWCRWAELPFVFAMWTARAGVHVDGLATALQQARDNGVKHLTEIATQEASSVGLSDDQSLRYLRDSLHFYLGPREQCGLNLFRKHAAQLGIVPAARQNDEENEEAHGCKTP